MSTPHYELLKDAYTIIDGIPEDHFALNDWYVPAKPGKCDTLACAAGWLAQHPDFIARGLAVNSRLGLFHADSGSMAYKAIGEVFNIDSSDARNIFCTRAVESDLDPEEPDSLSDKELWKARCYAFLKQHGQIRTNR